MKKFRIHFAIITAFIILIGPSVAHAAVNYNRLMDDFVYGRTSTMTASQIDSWLNSNFPSSCISTNNGFSASEPTGYTPSPSTFHYGARVSAEVSDVGAPFLPGW